MAVIAATLVGVLVSGSAWGQQYSNPWRNYETRQERMSLAKKIRKDLEIDKIDSLVPTLSPSQKEWLNKEMGKTTSPERWSSAAKSKEFALKHARQYITSIKSILDAFETAPHDKEFIIWVSLAYSLLNYGDFDLGLCVKKVIKNCPFPYTIRKGLIVSDLELAATQDAKVIIMGVLGPKFGTGFSK